MERLLWSVSWAKAFPTSLCFVPTTLTIPVLELKAREVECLAQGHTVVNERARPGLQDHHLRNDKGLPLSRARASWGHTGRQKNVPDHSLLVCSLE